MNLQESAMVANALHANRDPWYKELLDAALGEGIGVANALVVAGAAYTVDWATLNASYFAGCDRDPKGHCLPEGEGHEPSEALKIRKGMEATAGPLEKLQWKAMDVAAVAGKKVLGAVLKGLSVAGRAIYDRLPATDQHFLQVSGGFLKGLEHKLEGAYAKTQELAHEVAKQQGVSEEHADRAARSAAADDTIIRWVAGVPAVHAGLEAALGGSIHQIADAVGHEHAALVHTLAHTGMFIAAKIGYFIPARAMLKLGMTMARDLVRHRDPMHTIKKANAAIKDKKKDHDEAPTTHALAWNALSPKKFLSQLMARYDGMEDDAQRDWYETLVTVALDHAQGDKMLAFKLADAAFKDDPDGGTDDATTTTDNEEYIFVPGSPTDNMGPDQARDAHGKWTDAGAVAKTADAFAASNEAGVPRGSEVAHQTVRDWAGRGTTGGHRMAMKQHSDLANAHANEADALGRTAMRLGGAERLAMDTRAQRHRDAATAHKAAARAHKGLLKQLTANREDEEYLDLAENAGDQPRDAGGKFLPAHERQQIMAAEAYKKGSKVEGMSIRTLTRKQLERLKDKHDLTESEAFGAGFAGEGGHEVAKTPGGIITVRKRDVTANEGEEYLDLGDDQVGNVNKKGCNQTTGPGCSGEKFSEEYSGLKEAKGGASKRATKRIDRAAQAAASAPSGEVSVQVIPEDHPTQSKFAGRFAVMDSDGKILGIVWRNRKDAEKEFKKKFGKKA